jgi:hypothetical protein
MNHKCETCDGTGECPECQGSGKIQGLPIEQMRLDKWEKHYEELKELQADAKRVIRQAEELTALKPDRADLYRGQLAVCLLKINRQAEKVVRGKHDPVKC